MYNEYREATAVSLIYRQLLCEESKINFFSKNLAKNTFFSGPPNFSYVYRRTVLVRFIRISSGEAKEKIPIKKIPRPSVFVYSN